jgi:hypothetical protein
VVPQTQLLSDPSFPFSLSVARHYDKLKRIGHFDRCVPVFSRVLVPVIETTNAAGAVETFRPLILWNSFFNLASNPTPGLR